MDIQNNSMNEQQVFQPVRKKKRGCFTGCLLYVLLPVLVVTAAYFGISALLRNQQEKTTQQLNARFDYEKYESSETKLTRAFENGELSVDAYVMQMAYSMYEPDKLDPSNRSDNKTDFPPDIAGLFSQYIDELSDETIEYVANKLLLTDVGIHTDASNNPTAPKQGFLPFVTHAHASNYDVTVLNKAYLSPSGEFLFWYTDTGKSSVDDKVVQELAYTVDSIVAEIEDLLDIQWDYKCSVINIHSYIKAVVNQCGIDKEVITKAMPVYIYEPSDDGSAFAWYCKDNTWYEKELIKLVKPVVKLLDENLLKEYGTVYSLPYIVIKTSSITDTENLNTIFAHELTHHFQRIYYDDKSHNASGYTSETVANFTAASVARNTGTDTAINGHANMYVQSADHWLSSMELSSTTAGYAEYVWAKSYADIIDNGVQYLKESLLQKDPYEFLCEKAGDSYYHVLEDLAARNITKAYQQKGFVSTIYPPESGRINPYLDTIKGSFYANCFDYYYLDGKTYGNFGTKLLLNNTGKTRIFVEVIGRENDTYTIIDTLYCEPEKDVMLVDFAEELPSQYDEIILAVGHCETKEWAYYEISSVSEAAIDWYETAKGLEELNPWEVNGNCITINVDDLITGAEDLTGFLSRAIQLAQDVTDEEASESQQILSAELFDGLESEISRFQEDLKIFKDVFEYKTIRVYTMPIGKTILSSEELYETTLKTMPRIRAKILDMDQEGTHVTIVVGIQPFSDTQIIAHVMLASSDDEVSMYRIELVK